MRVLLALTFLIAFSAQAYAQDKITVINEDGTKTTIDIGESPVAPVTPKEKSVTPPPAAAPAQAPVVAAESAPKPVKKTEPKKQEPKKKPPAKKPAKPEKKKAAAVKTEKKVQKKHPSVPAAPMPKPVTDNAPVATPVMPLQQGLGEQMTPEDAIRIALDVAPPARSVNAVPVNHNGIHAYQVIFATEDGDRSVFVDRETGKIMK